MAAIGILRFSINSSSNALEERVRRVFAVRSGWIEQCPDVRDEFLALGQAGFDAGKGFFRRLKFLNLGRSGEKRFISSNFAASSASPPSLTPTAAALLCSLDRLDGPH